MESTAHFNITRHKGFTDVTHTLTIDNVQVEDAGTIKALAVNKAGEATCEATLSVDGWYNNASTLRLVVVIAGF